tara:strand:+ start:5447 stop:6049 length:603 start_codon:yes stop_codon:yes gene_type:complete
MENFILCPIRYVTPPNYDSNIKYIIHLRNPIDLLISQYYSFGFTHPPPPTDQGWPDCAFKLFNERRKKIQSQTIDEYCLSDENINDINNKYNNFLIWINKYKDKENVFISKYDNMYYDFSNWLKDIFNFLSLETYNETLSTFEKEFSNKYEPYIKNDPKTACPYRRSGLSKQYLFEIKKETLDLVINKLSDNIKNSFDFI